ncbi:hypothetical protein Clacol_009437 [Clathrus columnatus]|uniref:DUF6699 domain-containing protein n=1 Tax=Clathrus columnatus TaxID=1419009 RepID=A0AAV5AN41_9AGAM|nr:hypothetical protein Clacol_009437 [Clathrus columnatus]
MDVPRRPGQRPARLPPQPQPQPQHQHQPPLPQSPQSSGSSGSMHRRQHSPYVHPFFLQPPPYFPYPYPYPYPIYPYPPTYPGAPPQAPPPPPPLVNRPLHYPQRPRDTSKYREKEPCSPGVRLNDILRASPSQSLSALVWLITHRPLYAQSRRSEVHYSPVESLGPSIRSQPATDPPISRMNIVSNEFMWEIPIEVRPPAFITVETVLFAIYVTMQDGLTSSEWDAIEEPNVKKNAHWARCARLAKGDGPLTFNEQDSIIKRIDLLGDKVAFRGLVPMSNSGSRSAEFLIQLGSTQSNDKKIRIRRGSF